MIKVIVVIGTRPEVIKMAPVIRELRKHGEKIETIVLTTGQHRELLRQALDTFHIVPDHELDVMTEDQSLGIVTSRVLTGMEEVVQTMKPELILVQGDTTTSFAASLAAFYQQVKIGHVEAGLRTYNKYYPFPEEINRTLISRMADLHFAPTVGSAKNLAEEGIGREKILVTGNTVVDALFYMVEQDIELDFEYAMSEERIILVTAHRRENFGQPLIQICKAIRGIVKEYPDVGVIYPVHPNPNVRRVVKKELDGCERVHLIAPVDYVQFVHMMKRCYFVLTDSGGIQEEAPSLGKPVLVLRNESERPEGVEAGTVKIVGTDTKRIIEEAQRLLNDPVEYKRMSHASNPYGDGQASMRILDAILDYFCRRTGVVERVV